MVFDKIANTNAVAGPKHSVKPDATINLGGDDPDVSNLSRLSQVV